MPKYKIVQKKKSLIDARFFQKKQKFKQKYIQNKKELNLSKDKSKKIKAG